MATTTTKLSVYDYNAKLQTKKNKLRKELTKKGVLKREGANDYDKYKYFSEAQYKALFTELFSNAGLELSFTEVMYTPYTVEGKQPNGRMVKIKFILTDIETGFSEETLITGEGLDKGDKAGYKAYTGALKYYLANTFMVATGDDPEKDSPATEAEEKPKVDKPKLASDKQVLLCKRMAANTPALKDTLIEAIALSMGQSLDDNWLKEADDTKKKDFIENYIGNLTMQQASEFISNQKGAK